MYPTKLTQGCYQGIFVLKKSVRSEAFIKLSFMAHIETMLKQIIRRGQDSQKQFSLNVGVEKVNFSTFLYQWLPSVHPLILVFGSLEIRLVFLGLFCIHWLFWLLFFLFLLYKWTKDSLWNVFFVRFLQCSSYLVDLLAFKARLLMGRRPLADKAVARDGRRSDMLRTK